MDTISNSFGNTFIGLPKLYTVFCMKDTFEWNGLLNNWATLDHRDTQKLYPNRSKPINVLHKKANLFFIQLRCILLI